MAESHLKINVDTRELERARDLLEEIQDVDVALTTYAHEIKFTVSNASAFGTGLRCAIEIGTDDGTVIPGLIHEATECCAMLVEAFRKKAEVNA